eukprot:c20280_g2_i4 orf=72-299(-)
MLVTRLMVPSNVPVLLLSSFRWMHYIPKVMNSICCWQSGMKQPYQASRTAEGALRGILSVPKELVEQLRLWPHNL